MENWFRRMPFLFSENEGDNVPTRNRSGFSNPEFAGFLIFRRFRTTLYFFLFWETLLDQLDKIILFISKTNELFLSNTPHTQTVAAKLN